jgi:hypothetical protein
VRIWGSKCCSARCVFGVLNVVVLGVYLGFQTTGMRRYGTDSSGSRSLSVEGFLMNIIDFGILLKQRLFKNNNVF